MVLIYFQIDSSHDDNKRFKEQCEEWYGREIIVERAPEKYKDQFDVILKDKYVNGPSGAVYPCLEETSKTTIRKGTRI